MKPVTDPNILAQLNGDSGAGKPVTDPSILAQLEGDSKPSAFQRFGKAIPVAGSVLGGLVGGAGGTAFGMGVGGIPGAVGGSALGAAGGESARQILGKMLGEPSPATWQQSASGIGKEAALGAAGEGIGGAIGRGIGAGYKAFPKIAHGFSGTPAVNVARAQQRGFGVFAPGMSREMAGKAQGAVELPIVKKLFSPEERVLLRAKDERFADKLMRTVMFKQEKGIPISEKEAIGLRIMAPVKRAADTMRGIRKNVELDKATSAARGVIAEKYPELTKKLLQTEKSITAEQLKKILPVNKTNPDQISKLGAMLSLISGSLSLPFSSPLAMGTAGATMGVLKRRIPNIVKKTLESTGGQATTRTAVEALMGSRK